MRLLLNRVAIRSMPTGPDLSKCILHTSQASSTIRSQDS